jgi:hypothetical protein
MPFPRKLQLTEPKPLQPTGDTVLGREAQGTRRVPQLAPRVTEKPLAGEPAGGVVYIRLLPPCDGKGAVEFASPSGARPRLDQQFSPQSVKLRIG